MKLARHFIARIICECVCIADEAILRCDFPALRPRHQGDELERLLALRRAGDKRGAKRARGSLDDMAVAVTADFDTCARILALIAKSPRLISGGRARNSSFPSRASDA